MNNNAIFRRKQQAASRAVLRQRLLPLMVASCFVPAVLANPLGPQVVNGNASFNSQGNILSVTNTPGAIINWQAFSINPGEVTRFIQQNPHSSVLNRIVGQDPSQILGALQSNGRVFLVNPNGILFGQGAQVDVNGLVASTLSISNDDFINGRMLFKAGDKAAGLKNQGAITTPAGGKVYLIAPNVENSGIITSPKGEVLLAAGHTVQLVDSLDPNVQVVLSAPESEAVNLGQVLTQGGTAGIFGSLIRQRGVVSADSAVVGENGKVVFKASGDALLEAGSRTSARGAGKGGEVIVQGDRVGLLGDAHIDVSGDTGGGTVLLGGDYQGKNPAIMNARQTLLSAESVVKADAKQNGNGGKVIAWGDQSTQAYGVISARGGAAAGNGGFVETSAHYLDMQARVDTSAPNGQAGLLLLDPMDVYIANTDPGSTTSLGSVPGTSFTGSTDGDSWLSTTTLQDSLASNNVNVTSSGKIQITDPLAWNSIRELILNASGDVIINGTVSTGPGSLSAQTTGNVLVNGAISSSGTVDLKGNAVTVNASITADTLGLSGEGISGTGILSAKTFNFQSGSTGGIGFSANPLQTASIGGLAANADFNIGIAGATPNKVYINHTGAATLASFYIGTNAPVEISASDNLTVTSINTGTSDLKLSTGKMLTVPGTGSVALAGMNIDLTADRMAIQSGSSINAGTGTVAIKNKSAGRKIELGSSADTPDDALRLSNTELAAITAGKLKIGDTGITGDIDIVDSITAANAGMLILQAGGLIKQDTGKIITATNLGIRALGDVTLTAANAVANIAASIGDPSNQNRTFAFSNGTAALNIENGIDGMPGISINISGSYATGASGVIKLKSGGAITQSENSIIGGKAVFAEGARVDLTQLNPTGIVAGKATGVETGEAFKYKSTNGVVVVSDATHGYNGIETAAPNGLGVQLESSSNSVNVTAPVNAGSADVTLIANTSINGDGLISAANLEISAQSGIMLSATKAGTLKATNTGASSPINIVNTSTPILYLYDVSQTGSGDITISNTGPVIVHSGNAVSTTSGNILIESKATGSSADTVTVSGNVTSTTGNITLRAGGAISGNTPTTGAPGVVTLDANKNTVASPPPNSPPPAPPSIEQCVSNPQASGCNAVLPTLNQCTSAPTTPGCSVVLPTIDACVSAPSTSGCSAVLPTLSQCTASPAAAGCSIVLPTLTQCTVSPSTEGCGVVLPTVTQCTTAPSTAGCSVVLPKLEQCITNPDTTGCVAVLPKPEICASMPTTPGCAVVLPKLETCLAAPATLGCTVVLPTVAQCASNPQVSGCSVVLPSLAVCTAAPFTAGCSVVLPTLSQCTSAPVTTGCSAVLPRIAQCISAPATVGCSVVLPTMSQCTSVPATTGCSAVLPTIAQCMSAPSMVGCGVVLPTLSQCTNAPATTGCSAILPTIAQCTSAPSMAGCSTILPTLAQCTASPTLQGCAVVLPIANRCTTNPSADGCQTVLPTLPTITRSALADTVTTTSNTLMTIISASTSESSAVGTQSQSPSGGGSAGTRSDKKDSAKDDKKTSAGADDNGVKKNEITKKLYCN
jgi:filamentous hemagglutinin family protein